LILRKIENSLKKISSDAVECTLRHALIGNHPLQDLNDIYGFSRVLNIRLPVGHMSRQIRQS